MLNSFSPSHNQLRELPKSEDLSQAFFSMEIQENGNLIVTDEKNADFRTKLMLFLLFLTNFLREKSLEPQTVYHFPSW